MAALEVPLFSFGVVSDILGSSGKEKECTETLNKLDKACSYFGEHMSTTEFVLNLGSSVSVREEAATALEDVIMTFEQLRPMTIAHVLGDTDLECLAREEVLGSLKFPHPPIAYYTSEHLGDLAPGWRLIVLDTNDPEGIDPQAADRGNVGGTQLQWLHKELRLAEEAGHRVIVASHHPFAGAADEHLLARNHAEVKQMLCACRSFVCALAAGQDNQGSVFLFQHVHFVTIPCLTAAPGPQPTYALCQVFQEHITIKGVGAATSHKLRIPELLVEIG